MPSAGVSNCNDLPPWTGDVEQWVQAEHNAFFMCDKFEKPQWVELLPADGPDSDAFDEELYREYSYIAPVHNRLKVGALASVFRKYLWHSEQPMSSLRHFWLKQ